MKEFFKDILWLTIILSVCITIAKIISALIFIFFAFIIAWVK
jgi:hypothetical protein